MEIESTLRQLSISFMHVPIGTIREIIAHERGYMKISDIYK